MHVPRFTVSANDRHFQAISNIVTKLVLFTDPAHKTRAEKLESLLFSYDFTNFASAADVVGGMQDRLRQALETKSDAEPKLRGLGNPGRVELLKIDAHILLLVEELNMMFDAIKLAQDKANCESDQKSALLLHTSSEEVSWRMLDQQDQLLAKVAVRVTDFYWLSRHDSSTVNNLAVGDLQAFDGAADAEWTEILSKYDEPITHPLVKVSRGFRLSSAYTEVERASSASYSSWPIGPSYHLLEGSPSTKSLSCPSTPCVSRSTRASGARSCATSGLLVGIAHRAQRSSSRS